MKYEISPKTFQARFYDESDPDNYVACLQLYKDGDRGFIHSLIGKDFYRRVLPMVKEMMENVGLKSLEAYVLEHHARLLEIVSTRSALVFERAGEGSHSGRNMIWVRISLNV